VGLNIDRCIMSTAINCLMKNHLQTVLLLVTAAGYIITLHHFPTIDSIIIIIYCVNFASEDYTLVYPT